MSLFAFELIVANAGNMQYLYSICAGWAGHVVDSEFEILLAIAWRLKIQWRQRCRIVEHNPHHEWIGVRFASEVVVTRRGIARQGDVGVLQEAPVNGEEMRVSQQIHAIGISNIIYTPDL